MKKLLILSSLFAAALAYAAPEENLLTLARGATVVSASAAPEKAVELINGNVDDIGWSNGGPKYPLPYTFVFELLAPTKLSSVGVRTADDRPGGAKGAAAKTVEVEASNDGPETGYQKLGTLEAALDSDASLDVDGVTARWLRFTITANHGNKDWTYLREVMAHGEQDNVPDDDGRFNGRFNTNLGRLELKQQGTAISGCYEAGTVLGEVSGGVARINWVDSKSKGVQGTALFVINSKGDLTGVRYRLPGSGPWSGPSFTGDEAICPETVDNPIQQAIATSGNVILYGIYFDTDSDELTAKSEATLRQLLDALQQEADIKVDIEGHTDDEGGESHNQDLSQRRATAVAVWLTNEGVDGARLNPVGKGEMDPVAENETAVGRALNRRVEVVRQ